MFPHDPKSEAARAAADRQFWRANSLLITSLLIVWAVVSLGAGILWIEPLNQWTIGQIPFGFWMAQQGSIIAFVLIILVYVLCIGPLERRHRHQLHELYHGHDGEQASAPSVSLSQTDQSSASGDSAQ